MANILQIYTATSALCQPPGTATHASLSQTKAKDSLAKTVMPAAVRAIADAVAAAAHLLHHALDLILAEATLVVGDGDLVLLAGGLVLSRHVEDTVGVNVEHHVDLGHTTGSWGDAAQLELAQQVVVACASTLTLVHLRDRHNNTAQQIRARSQDL